VNTAMTLEVWSLLALIFIDLAFILLLYRKEFLPDVVVVKKRRRKWEDLYIREVVKTEDGTFTNKTLKAVFTDHSNVYVDQCKME